MRALTGDVWPYRIERGRTMDNRSPSEGARPDMVFALANGWQIAAGLPLVKRRRDLATHLADLLSLPAPPHTLLERLLLRGYYLEIACALHAVIPRCRDTEGRRRLGRLVDGLRHPDVDTRDLEARVRDAVEWLRDPSLSSQRDLAQRTRVELDEWKGHFSLTALARRVGSNATYVKRRFKREFGGSPVEYLRRRRTTAVIQALGTGAASRKELADQLGCAEATVRRFVRAATGHSPRHMRNGQCPAPRTARQIISKT